MRTMGQLIRLKLRTLIGLTKKGLERVMVEVIQLGLQGEAIAQEPSLKFKLDKITDPRVSDIMS